MSSPDKELDDLRIPYEEIVSATNNFDDQNLLHQDLYAKVYTGQLLRSGRLVNVVVQRVSRLLEQGMDNIHKEMLKLSRLKHKNIVSYVGFCQEQLLIIYEHVENRSLDKYLSDPTLGWMQRLHICVGVARALSYVYFNHQDARCVIRGNIHSSKILLDRDWEAKLLGIRPFGSRYSYDEVDVYPFGVLLFEILCGKKTMINLNQEGESDDEDLAQEDHRKRRKKSSREDRHKRRKSDAKEQDQKYESQVALYPYEGRQMNDDYLVRMAKDHYEEGELDRIIDPNLRTQMHPQSLAIFSQTAYRCLKEQHEQRPVLDEILKELEEALQLQVKHENTWMKLEHLKIQLNDILQATNNFSKIFCIGSGSYGKVYKGKINYFDRKAKNEGKVPTRRGSVAIKRISNRDDGEGEQGFFLEIEMLSRCQHPNIVSLLGFCYEGREMILVYEYAFKRSLDDYLESTDRTTNLTWVQRIQICLDIAMGLNYLHNNIEDKPRIIHRDIKSANILLGEAWNAKIADFGLSKFHPVNQQASTINTNNIAGTSVYLDPEYERTGKLKKESDIYSFGVVLFEILSGRLAYDSIYLAENDKGLAPVARRRFNDGTLKEMVDPNIKKEADELISNVYYGPNQDSLDTFSRIAYQCLAETQDKRPTIEDVIKNLQNALSIHENRKDTLKFSLEDIKLCTENFSDSNCIIRGVFGKAYNGKVQYSNEPKDVVVKQSNRCSQEEFLTELQILIKHKHENVIGLVGYCMEKNEKIIVYEHASVGSLDMHLSNVNLGWEKRLKICIDVASALEFLHEGVQRQESVIHRDMKSASILLNGNWRARISDFGLSLVIPKDMKTDYVANEVVSTPGYCDPLYWETGFLTKESDIYSLGVVLFEILCGRLTLENYNYEGRFLNELVENYLEEGKLDEIVFEGIKQQIASQSLTTFQMVAYQCLHHRRKKRPTASEVVLQLKKALDFQEEYEVWERKLPKDYKQIFDMSESPKIYFTKTKKDLYNMLSQGILIQEGKMWFLFGINGERIEMVSARMFSYKIRQSHKWRSDSKSRFRKVAQMLDISNLKIQIKRTIHSVSPHINYRVHLVFRFCEPRKSSTKRMYVNLKYQKGSESLHTYFAIRREDGWLMTELCQFSTDKGDFDFVVLLESFSKCYCGSRSIYVEGIEFHSFDNVNHEEIKLKEVHQVLKSNVKMDMMQQFPINSEETSKRSQNYNEGEKVISLTDVNRKKRLALLAKEVFYDSSGVKLFHLIQSVESRFEEGIKLRPRQVFHIKCKIESQMLSPFTDYMCYLVFKLSENCRGLHCPVKIRDILHWKNKENRILFFRSPTPLNQHDANLVPKQRDDGLMEVNVWKFNSNDELRKNIIPMNLKLISYEGTMSGLIVHGLEIRPKL